MMMLFASQGTAWTYSQWGVLTGSQDDGLKINTQKSKFCTKEIKYLGCVLTTDCMMQQPRNMKTSLRKHCQLKLGHLHRILGMVQYSRDFWAKDSSQMHLTGRRVLSYQSLQQQQTEEDTSCTGVRYIKQLSMVLRLSL
jgi:hypothetical protein